MDYDDNDYKEMMQMQSVADIEKFGTVISAEVCELANTLRSDKVIKTIELCCMSPLYPSVRQYIRIAEDKNNEDWQLGDRVKILIVKEEGK